MQSGINMYPPFLLSPWRLTAIVGIIIVVIAGKFLIKRWLKHLALQTQRRVTREAQTKDPKLLDNALTQLANLHNAYMRRELSADSAVEQASILVRETYDQIMNHRTRYQARYEVAARQLQHVEQLMTKTYPVEFAKTSGVVADAAVIEVFAKAEEVIESCR